jgi:hypothetical protein
MSEGTNQNAKEQDQLIVQVKSNLLGRHKCWRIITKEGRPQGEVGLTVYSILVRYWEWSSQETRSTLYLMSLETHSPPTH